MKRVTISLFKAHLSAHIQLVRQGEEVLVCDRNKPVARLVPCAPDNDAAQQQRLVDRGTLVPPRRAYPASKAASWPRPPGNISDEAMKRVWEQEREAR